jgi:hypothetical protein
VKLAAVREQLAADITGVTDAEVAVVDFPPDQLSVPAVFVMWGAPWLTLHNKCKWDANLDILLVAARFEPSGAFDTIEDLVEDVLPLLEGGAWRFSFLEAPAPMDVGGVTYLAARLTVSSTIDN